MIKIAYFSAEVGISSRLPTYSGGLGVLAGDYIKAAADAGLPLCAVTLLYREGYFQQHLDEDGNQTESFPRFDPDPWLKKLPHKFNLQLRGRDVWIQAYEYLYRGLAGQAVPVYFLDTDLPENAPEDRLITLRLYSGDKDHRILQEAILGFGGLRLLDKLGHRAITTYHLNEGHCAFLTLELLERCGGDREAVRRRCHFTTHTPAVAGHDHFAVERCRKLLQGLLPQRLELPSLVQNSRLHMTELGLHFSRSANGVSRLHGEVARKQFPDFQIDHITNGVYHPYWVGEAFRQLYDRHLPGWRENPARLREVASIPPEELEEAHGTLRRVLLEYANSRTRRALDPALLTIGFARRAAAYKRAHLIFHDPRRLAALGQGRLQIIFAGKAHPRDKQGKQILRDIVEQARRLSGKVTIIFLEDYDLRLGRLLTAGVDVWLNTPLRPHEASGTSGMKAALNGIPNLSVRDGWWAEGCEHGVNGWAIGGLEDGDDAADAADLYSILEREVIPTFYQNRRCWVALMQAAIRTGARFTAHRMVQEYYQRYYQI